VSRDRDARREFVEGLVRDAGRRSLAGHGAVEPIEKDSADGYDIATVVDHEVEALVKERIQAAWGEPVLGEEGGLQGDAGRARERVWVVDPIDGTFNFRHGLYLYGVTVACCERGVPTVAATYLPALDELYVATAGGGAWRHPAGGGAPLRLSVSPETRPERAIVILDGRHLGELFAAWFAAGLPRRSVRSLLCASASLAWTAEGRANGFVLSSGSVWDCAAGDLLLREAGGPPCCDAEGAPLFPRRLDDWLSGAWRGPIACVAASSAALRDATILPAVRTAVAEP